MWCIAAGVPFETRTRQIFGRFKVFEDNFGQSSWAKVRTKCCFCVNDAADLFLSLIKRCQGIASSSWIMMLPIFWHHIVRKPKLLAVSTT
jgi:hypothetical protein